MGVLLALLSSALDSCTYYIIRYVGGNLPKALIPFMSGLFTTIFAFIYCLIYEPFDTNLSNIDDTYKWALIYGSLGSLMGWFALNFLVIGLRISKSALA